MGGGGDYRCVGGGGDQVSDTRALSTFRKSTHEVEQQTRQQCCGPNAPARALPQVSALFQGLRSVVHRAKPRSHRQATRGDPRCMAPPLIPHARVLEVVGGLHSGDGGCGGDDPGDIAKAEWTRPTWGAMWTEPPELPPPRDRGTGSLGGMPLQHTFATLTRPADPPQPTHTIVHREKMKFGKEAGNLRPISGHKLFFGL